MTQKLTLLLFVVFIFFMFAIPFSQESVLALENTTYNISSTIFEQQESSNPEDTSFCDITVVNNVLYVANSQQATKVVGYNLDTIDSNTTTTINLPDNYYPTKIKYDYYNEMFYFASKLTFGIGTSTTQSQYTTFYEETDLETPISMQNIFDFTISMNGTIFAITTNIYGESIIIYKQQNSEKFKLLCNLNLLSSPITLTSSSKIVCDTYGTTIWFSVSDTIYEYNIETGFNTLTYHLPNSISNIVDMKLDFLGNLYIYATYQSQNAFIKSNSNNFEIVCDEQNVLNINGFCFNYETGNIFSFTNTQLYNISITNQNSGTPFFLSYDQVEKDTSWQTTTLTQVCSILSLHEQSMLYPFENLYKQGIVLDENTKVVLLKDLQNSMFDFVLVNNYQSCNTVGYIKKSKLTGTETVLPEISQVIPIFSNTPIYKYPSSLTTEGEDELIALTVTYQSQNTSPVFNVLESAKIDADFNNVTFYAIKYGNLIGYVDINMVISQSESNNAVQRNFIANAKARENATVYADFNLTKPSTTLNLNTAIQIETVENGVCKIYWLNDDKLFVGYISKNLVDDGNLTTTQIIGIAIMAVAIITTLLVIIISSIRRKKYKEKIKQTKQSFEN